MANRTKDIKFNFSDGGSLKKMKALYDESMREMTDRSGKYRGGSIANQERYLREELQYLKEITKEREKQHKARVKSFEEIKKFEEYNEARLRKGYIPQEDYDARTKDLQKQRRGLLSGTGYRKEHTYMKGEGGIINEQNQALSRMEKTLRDSKETLREILSNDKETALKRIDAIEKNTEASHEEKLAAQQARAHIENRGRRGRGQVVEESKSIVADLFTAGNLNQLLGNVRGALTSTDAISATQRTVEAATSAGVAGLDFLAALVEGAGDRWIGKAGARAAGGIIRGGGRVGKTLVDTSAEIAGQHMAALNEYQARYYKNRALSGGNLDPFSMSEFGYSGNESLDLMNSLMRAQGSSRGIQGTTRSAQLLERGAGVETSIIQQLLELTRSANETDKNIEAILGGMWREGQQIFGGDRTFLNEFATKNFAGLYRQLQQNQTSVSSGSVMSALSMFDSVGGQFGARHPNSMGLISNINSALTNPQGDTMDALTFMAMRQSMPGASMGDILREREKGMSSPSYLRAMMGQIGMMGGDEDFQMMQVANAFGINYGAATDLVRNRDKIGRMSDGELTGYFSNLEGEAEQNTTFLQERTAKIADATVAGTMEKVEEMTKSIISTFREAMNNQTYILDPETGQIVAKIGARVNVDKKPKGADLKESQTKMVKDYFKKYGEDGFY